MEQPNPTQPRHEDQAWQLCLPFVLYVVLTQLIAAWPDWYPTLYCAVVLLTGLGTWYCYRGADVVRLHARLGLAVVVGFVGIAAWIGLCQLGIEEQLAPHLPAWLRPTERVGFDPFTRIESPLARWLFIGVRLLGLALLVPLVEEVFWRGFLMRWLVHPDWQQVPIGAMTPTAFWLVTLLFTLAHPEWVAAAAYGALLNLYLLWKRDLWGCVVAHAISNLLLGIYVLTTGSWRLW